MRVFFRGSDTNAAGLSRTRSGGDDSAHGLQLIGEVRHTFAECLRIAAGAVPRALRGAQRAWQVVVGVSDISAMLRIERDLEKICEAAAVAIAASRAIGADGARMNDMIAGRALHEFRRSIVAVNRFRGVDVPLRPAVDCSVSARRLHSRNVIRISRQAGAEPGDNNVAVGVRRHPGKHVRFANSCPAVYANRRGPSGTLICR